MTNIKSIQRLADGDQNLKMMQNTVNIKAHCLQYVQMLLFESICWHYYVYWLIYTAFMLQNCELSLKRLFGLKKIRMRENDNGLLLLNAGQWISVIC